MEAKNEPLMHQNDEERASKQRNIKEGNYHPINGPDTNRLREMRFGKLTNPSTDSLGMKTPTLSTRLLSISIKFPDAKPNLIGKFLLARKRFKDSGFRKTSFPLEKSGVADCESFQAGEERKRGPESGIHLEKGWKSLVCEEARLRKKEKDRGGGNGGEKTEREAVADEWNGRESPDSECLWFLLVFLRRRFFKELKIAIATGELGEESCSPGPGPRFLPKGTYSGGK